VWGLWKQKEGKDNTRPLWLKVAKPSQNTTHQNILVIFPVLLLTFMSLTSFYPGVK
jgi:hypothetical protein